MNWLIFKIVKCLLWFTRRTKVVYNVMFIRTDVIKNKENSKDYFDWVAKTGQSDLTGSQSDFAQFLLDNKKELEKKGEFLEVFESVYKYVKGRIFEKGQRIKYKDDD